MTHKELCFLLSLFLLTTSPGIAQGRFELLPFGDMNQWISREIRESFIIGGNTTTLYEVADSTRVKVPENTPYKNRLSPWATSSVYAKVKGITKGSVTVFPEKRGAGYAARLETRIETVKVFGVININVLASGTLFLGEVIEPITDTKNPMQKIMAGIPFTKKPSFLQFDYKVVAGGPSRKVNGLSKKGTETGTTSRAVAYIFLTQRSEDKDGNVHAKRIGTGWQVFDKTVAAWQNSFRVPIHYGDITMSSFYTEKWGLKNGDEAYYTYNSKGKIVPIQEEGWGTADDRVTHIFIQFSSSDGGPYVGNPEGRLWIDNVGLVYK